MEARPRVLVACEESGTVVDAFKHRWGGSFEVYSCDLLPTSGKHPDVHIQVDALELIKMEFDCLLSFPPCTHLAVSGARYFEEKRANGKQDMAIGFFKALWTADIPHICIENPVGIMSSEIGKPTQVINPWQFGHPEQKKTCLWLKDLPPLQPTKDVYEEMMAMPKSERERILNMSPSPERARERSVTYKGVAAAMADQWGRYLLEGPHTLF